MVECHRPGCSETRPDNLRMGIHLAQDHPPLREEVDNYPRPPEQR
jgi:hypothetical protein